MGRASTPTLLPLDSYARIMGIDPRHFNGIVTPVWPANRSCAAIWYQYAWQNVDAVSREDLAEAIQQAEADIAKELGFFVAPSWVEEERQRWTFTHPQEYRFDSNIGLVPRGLRKTVRTVWAKIFSGGIRATADIAVPTAVPISWDWSDEDGDGEDDTLTIGGTPGGEIDFGDVTDPCEVAVYFAGHAADECYRIRPITVDIAAGTIVISRWLLVNPILWEGQQGEIDGLVPGNFVDEVDIYRLYNDPSEQVRFEWEPLPTENCDDVCGYWYQLGCLGVRDHRRGLVVPYPGRYSEAEWTGVDFLLSREPDRVRLWYRSGEPLEDCEMIRFWQRAVAYYATALLQRKICGCEALERQVAHWAEPPSLEYELWPDRATSNPFGPQRGAMFAWDKVQQNLIGRGIAV